MFRGRRELLERFDRLESQIQQLTRGLERVAGETDETQRAIAAKLGEVGDSVDASAQALRGEISTAAAPLASSRDQEVLRTRLEEVIERLGALEVAASQTAATIRDRGADIAAVAAAVGKVEGGVAAAADGLGAVVQRASERSAGSFAQVETKLERLPARADIEPLVERLDAIERRMGLVHERISKLVQENVAALAKPASEIEAMRAQLSAAVDELKDWRQKAASETQQSLVALRSAAGKLAEEGANGRRAVDQAAANVRMAAQDLGTKLADSIDRHLAAEVVPMIQSTIEDLQKLLNRLEARGASPYKTAKAKILENLKRKDVIGGKHTPWENALTGLDGPEREVADEALKAMIRDGLVIEKPTASGPHVFLDPKRLPDVDRVINGEEL